MSKARAQAYQNEINSIYDGAIQTFEETSHYFQGIGTEVTKTPDPKHPGQFSMTVAFSPEWAKADGAEYMKFLAEQGFKLTNNAQGQPTITFPSGTDPAIIAGYAGALSNMRPESTVDTIHDDLYDSFGKTRELLALMKKDADSPDPQEGLDRNGARRPGLKANDDLSQPMTDDQFMKLPEAEKVKKAVIDLSAGTGEQMPKSKEGEWINGHLEKVRSYAQHHPAGP